MMPDENASTGEVGIPSWVICIRVVGNHRRRTLAESICGHLEVQACFCEIAPARDGS
jgi:hypothetical protein